MSSLIIAHNSQLMMLEVAIGKLFVASSSPFDAVIMSKFIVSFRFDDDDWIDIVPNRLDYKKYRGSSGEEHPFNGGKSVVYAVPGCYLTKDSQVPFTIEMRARREISEYFETENHVTEVGQALVYVKELFDGITEELRVRRELGDYLKLAHGRDPVSRSLKGTYTLIDPVTCEATASYLEVYARLSHLGNSVITEIDRPFTKADSHFYACEETNLGPSYEMLELASGKPCRSRPLYSMFKDRDLECDCTDEQRCKLLMGDGMTTKGTSMDDGKKGKKKPPKKKKVKEKAIETEPVTVDKAIGTESKRPSQGKKKDLSYEDWIKLIRSKRRGTGGTVGIIDKKRPCEIPCPPCYTTDICITNPSDFGCLPIASCPLPAVCCYN